MYTPTLEAETFVMVVLSSGMEQDATGGLSELV